MPRNRSLFNRRFSGFTSGKCFPCLSCTLVIILAGCHPTANAQLKSENRPEEKGAGRTALEVVSAGKPVHKDLVFVTTQPARIQAIEQAPIHSKLPAYVAEVLADYGDHVGRGQVLIKLSAPEIDADVAQKHALAAQSEAELAQAEASAKAAKAAVTTAESRVIQTSAGIARAQADVARWRLENARIGELVASGAINGQIADETRQKLAAAEAAEKEMAAAIEAVKAVVVQTQAELAKAEADIAAAKSRVRVAAANVKQAESIQKYLAITAPFDGVVTQRDVDPGHFVQPAANGARPLLTIARTDKIRVFVPVPEHEALYVDLQDPVSIEIQSLRGLELPGKISRTTFALDSTSRTLEAICDLDNPDERLRPGMFATVKITLHQSKNALTLPSAAVVRQGKEAFCYRLVNGKATRTPIQIGIKVGDDFEIVTGITEDQTIILNKAANLADGQAVEVAKPTVS